MEDFNEYIHSQECKEVSSPFDYVIDFGEIESDEPITIKLLKTHLNQCICQLMNSGYHLGY